MNGYTLEDFAVTAPVTNADLLAYATSHINLPADIAKKYREQVNSLRDRLANYIKDHPDYDLVKMLHSGSLAKGTALRRINDIDTAIYVRAAAVGDVNNMGLIAWLRDRIKEVYPNFDDAQLEAHDHCVTVHYKTPGRIDVDVVPVLYSGDPNNKGDLVTKDGTRVMTSISMHLDFIRKRKAQQPDHYAQLIRFVKYWAAIQKKAYKDRGDNPHFRFKSLMAELICAHLADNGLDASDYTEALRQFFTYIVQTGLKEPIIFTDYYRMSDVQLSGTDVIQIYDPVNPRNNIARTYTEAQRQLIVTEAKRALNAIIIAANATTKEEAAANWKVVFGTTFGG
jgi:hypothetical protein